MFKPSAQQFTTPIRIQHRVTTDVNGAPEISFSDASPALDFCAWKGRGGTESTESGSLIIDDTAEVTMWFRPDVSDRDVIMQEEASTSWQIAYDVLIAERAAEVAENGSQTELAISLAIQIASWLLSRPVYEVINVENVEMRNQFMIMKVQRAGNA